MAATINYFNEFPLVRHSDKIGMLGVTKVSYLPAKILYVSIISPLSLRNFKVGSLRIFKRSS